MDEFHEEDTIQVYESDNGGDVVADLESDNQINVPIEVSTDSVVPVYSTVDDETGLPIAYDIFIDDQQAENNATENVDETNEVVEYSTEELLLSINNNMVDGIGVGSALIGLLAGLIVGFEVLKIWLA